MPTAVTALANYSYEVTDSRGLTTFKPFSITVNAGADTTPAFAADASIADQFYTVGTPITPLTLPEATGGNGALAYALLAPPGLNFDLTTRVLSGTPTTAAMELTYSYFARDADNDGVALLIMITVNAAADTAPAFADGATIPVQLYTVGTTIATLTLPEATGGNDALTYALTRVGSNAGLPPGLTFDGTASPPTITGTPTEQTGGPRPLAFAYTVTDADGNTADSDSDTLNFPLGVFTGTPPVSVPPTTGIGTGPNSGTIALFYPLGAAITPTTFPAGVGGMTPYTYTATNTPPVGLTFDAAGRVLSGTPSAPGVTSFNYRVTDSSASPGSSFLTTRITICESGGAADGATTCTAPTFVTLALTAPDNQAFITDAAITPLTLPEATGGYGTNPVRIYTATPLPAGLTFDPMTREITGTPTTAATTTVSYRVGDAGTGNADATSATVMFDIVVTAPAAPTAFTLAITPATVTESATATDLTATVTLTGGTFAVERVVTVGETTGGSATSGTDYTAVTDTNVTIPAMMTTASATIPFTAADDMETEAGGETVNFDGSLLTADGMGVSSTFAVATASITINDFVVPPTSQTLTLNPTAVTESATPTNIMATVTLNGGAYAVDRVFSFGSSSGTAIERTDYTALQDVTLTIPANMTSGTTTFPFSATVDTVTEAGGETVNIRTTLLTIAGTGGDRSIPAGAATLTINDPVAPGTDTAPTFSVTSITAQTFTIGTAVDLTLPAATGGNDAIVYTLTPAIPGLTLAPATGVLTGMPTAAAAAADHTYTAADSDANEMAGRPDLADRQNHGERGGAHRPDLRRRDHRRPDLRDRRGG